MLSPIFAEDSKPIYEQLYEYIKQEIRNQKLTAGEKLPSRRKLASHLQISANTVENAYAQLMAEGYIEAQAKKGYFVCRIESLSATADHQPTAVKKSAKAETDQAEYEYILQTNAVDTKSFPFSIWTQLMRESLRDEYDGLLNPLHPQGDQLLRQEIARYLRDFRAMNVDAEQIILGAGAEYLLGLICELLPGYCFALEDPCYNKQRRILDSRGVAYLSVPMDAQGMRCDLLWQSRARVAIATPSRHFPLTTVMRIERRMELLKWACQDSGHYVVEDDFDSEYRYQLKQIPSLHSLDSSARVIYLNTFARTLAPSLRIGYMALPYPLLERYREKLIFYSCTVSEFEQSTLRRFIGRGYYERHLNRMRQIYKSRRDVFINALAPLKDELNIIGAEGGLHLLLQHQRLSEKELISKAASVGVKVFGLSAYYHSQPPETHTVIAGYGGHAEEPLKRAAALLVDAWQ